MTYYTQGWAQFADRQIQQLERRIEQLERQLAEAEIYRRELDEQLIIHHLGTLENFDTPKRAHVALQQWCYDQGRYDAERRTVTDEQEEKIRFRVAAIYSAHVNSPMVGAYMDGYRTALKGEG